jgi:predicted GNAT family acetyltransferase
MAMQRALESVWAQLYAELDGARFERRGDLMFVLYPPLPIPQCNGPWVVDDTPAAATALAEAIAEVEEAGAAVSVQTRSGHERAQRAAAELGLTHRETLPGMVMRPEELVEHADTSLPIDLIEADEIATANGVLATAFGAPKELFDDFAHAFTNVEAASWYVGRADDEIVATALGITIDDVTGVFNVATMPDHRGRGHGAALTARVVRDGFERGSRLAFLQSSALGHRVYQRLGFRDVEEYVLLSRPAAG